MIPGGASRSPVAFLARAAMAFPDRTALVDGERRRTWQQVAGRARRLAAALRAGGVEAGDRVAFLAPPCAELLEAHFGVPAAGAVLVVVDARLGEERVAEILRDEDVRVLLAEAGARREAAAAAARAGVGSMLVCGAGARFYEAALAGAGAARPASVAAAEDALLGVSHALDPGGQVVRTAQTHRDAWLDALAEAHHARLDAGSACLWALPTVHCGGGWCFPWVGCRAAALQMVVRDPDPATVWRLLAGERITHLCGEPALLAALPADPAARHLPRSVLAATGTGALPPAVAGRLAAVGIEVGPVLGPDTRPRAASRRTPRQPAAR